MHTCPMEYVLVGIPISYSLMALTAAVQMLRLPGRNALASQGLYGQLLDKLASQLVSLCSSTCHVIVCAQCHRRWIGCILLVLLTCVCTCCAGCGLNGYLSNGRCLCWAPNLLQPDGINCCRKNAVVVNGACACKPGFMWSEQAQACELGSPAPVAPTPTGGSWSIMGSGGW